jgi:hypothetical protein
LELGENSKLFSGKVFVRFWKNKMVENINKVGVSLLDHTHKAYAF